MTITVKGEFLELREFNLPAKTNGEGKSEKPFKLTLVRLFCRSAGEVIEYKPKEGLPIPVVGKEIEVRLRLRAYVAKGGLAAIGAEQVL